MQAPGAMAQSGSPVCSAAFVPAQSACVPQPHRVRVSEADDCSWTRNSTAYQRVGQEHATISEVIVG